MQDLSYVDVIMWVMKKLFVWPTRVRGKTFPEKLLSSIISLTLTSAGYWALFSCKKIQLLFCVEGARYKIMDLDKRLKIANVYLLVWKLTSCSWVKVRVERSVGGAADPQERSEVNSKLPRYLNPVGLRFGIYNLKVGLWKLIWWKFD